MLPDGILGSPGLGYVRGWILSNARILASIDLHPDTFQPDVSIQTSVLVLQRKSHDVIAVERRREGLTITRLSWRSPIMSAMMSAATRLTYGTARATRLSRKPRNWSRSGRTVRTTGDAYSEFWGVSTDYDTTFAPRPIPLLREVVEADRVSCKLRHMARLHGR